MECATFGNIYSPSQIPLRSVCGKSTMLDEEAASLCDIAIPKLRLAPFETAIIERYRRRESSVEESLIEMYLAGVSVRRVEDVTELL